MEKIVSSEYRTGMDCLEVFSPAPEEACFKIAKALSRRMLCQPEIKAAVFIGDHFEAETQEEKEETFSMIETILVAKGDSLDRFHEKCRKDYVMDIWNAGMHGGIEFLTEKDLRKSGGIQNWLRGIPSSNKKVVAGV